MSDDLRWNWCNNNRNKVHIKCNALGSWNHPTHIPGPWKNCLPWHWSLMPKGLGTAALEAAILHNLRNHHTFPTGCPSGWHTLKTQEARRHNQPPQALTQERGGELFVLGGYLHKTEDSSLFPKAGVQRQNSSWEIFLGQQDHRTQPSILERLTGAKTNKARNKHQNT